MSSKLLLTASLLLVGGLLVGGRLPSVQVAAEAATTTSPAFQDVSFLRTGFGVPGSSRPFVYGNYCLVNGGEGDVTLCDVSDKQNPKVARYIPSWYMSSFVYPLLSQNMVYLSQSGNGSLLTLRSLNTLQTPTGLAANSEFKSIPWNATWGNAYLVGLRPDGIGYKVANQDIVTLDLNDPTNPKELGRFTLSGLKGRAQPTDDQGVTFADDYRLSAAIVNNGQMVQLVGWPSTTSPVLYGGFPNESITDAQGHTTYGRVLAMNREWLILGHPASADPYWKCNTITFWDIRDPSRPKRGGDYTLSVAGTNIRDLALNGRHVYLIDGRDIASGHTVPRAQRSRLYVLGISLAAQPSVMSTFVETMPTEYGQLTYSGHTLYVNDYNYGLRLFDMSNPSQPVKLGAVPTAAEGHWLYLNGNHVYLANTFGGNIQIINVADPANPSLAGYYWDGQWLNRKAKIRGKGNAMYLPQFDGLAVVDLTDPTRPVRVGECLDEKGKPLGLPCLDVSGNYAFVTTAPSLAGSLFDPSPSRLLIYDITNPLKPQLAAVMGLPDNNGYRVLVAGSMLYLVAYGGNRYLAVDVTNPRAPAITADLHAPTATLGQSTISLAITDTGGNGAPGLAYSQGYLYVTTGLPDEHNSPAGATLPYLLIFDVKNRSSISLAGTLYVTDRKGWQYYSHDVLIQNNRLYLSDYGSVAAYDITNPLSPTQIAVHTHTYAFQVGALQNNYLYVPHVDGLDIVKVP